MIQTNILDKSYVIDISDFIFILKVQIKLF